MPRDPAVIARELLGDSAEVIEPLVAWPTSSVHRVTVRGARFVIKADDDHDAIAREAAGLRRAAAAGVPVPELIGVAEDALAINWVDGVALSNHPTSLAWRNTGTQLRTAHDVGGHAPFGAGFGGYEQVHPSWCQFFEAFAERELSRCRHDPDFPSEQADRIRDALRRSSPFLDEPQVGWCHGDFQPEHVLVDPVTDEVVAIIDWADHGSGDIGWDVAVLALDHGTHLAACLEGYGASAELRAALDATLPLFTVVRLLGEANWLADHNLPNRANLARAIAWRP